MTVSIIGDGALADVLKRAAELRQIKRYGVAELFILAVEVRDHSHMNGVDDAMRELMATAKGPIVVTSQVPPGWTRQWNSPNVFCQPHTIISGRELDCATFPKCFVVGCANPTEPLPTAYRAYLTAFGAPIIQVGYETAELSKLALSYLLASQIEAVNKLALVAGKIGADWLEIAQALRMDPRVGQHAYLRPGRAAGHLPRDVKTVDGLLA